MKLKNGFLEALLNEIALQSDFLEGEVVESIYFGGGTPSLLSGDEISSILQALSKSYHIHSDAEITVEANPDDIVPEKLISWKSIGINRLSIGVQSFFEEDLRWMNRAHSASQAEQSIILSQEAGFENLTIDLIFGTPTLSDENWKHNVHRAIELRVPHLSCYALTVEPKTPLDTLINKKKWVGLDQEVVAHQFLSLMDWLNQAGYEQYEISNYSLPGWHSRHNSSYWQGKKYLGLGPSAHSFDGARRQWNVANNALYIQSLQKSIIPAEAELLTSVQKLNEWIMTSLRTNRGISFNQPAPYLNENIIEKLKEKSIKYQKQQLIDEQSDALILTTRGKLFADGIAADLFFDETDLLNNTS